MSVMQKISSSIPKDDWHSFILTGLNLDHTWVPLHLLRSMIRVNSKADNLVEELTIKSLINPPANFSIAQFTPSLFDYSLETRELYPEVFQVILKTRNNENKYDKIDFHMYPHESPGRQVDFQSLQDNSFTKDTEHVSHLLMLKKDRFSSTFSWFHPDLNCRVYAPWKYVEL